MAELKTDQNKSNVVNDVQSQFSDQFTELKDKGTQIFNDVKERVSDAMEGNSLTLYAIGGGILLAGLVTYLIATRRKGMDEGSESLTRAA